MFSKTFLINPTPVAAGVAEPQLRVRVSFFSVLLLLLVMIPLSKAEAAGEGRHMWDRAHRRPSSATHQLTRRDFYSPAYNDAYYQRTETHALHPYYRNNYSTFLDVSGGRSNYFQRRMFLSGFPDFRVPSATSCSNYSYVRENYRTPPGEFRCLRH